VTYEQVSALYVTTKVTLSNITEESRDRNRNYGIGIQFEKTVQTRPNFTHPFLVHKQHGMSLIAYCCVGKRER
jgi:hypothetical protein